MAKQVLTEGDGSTHGTQRTKINANFTELYDSVALKQASLDGTPTTPPAAGGLWYNSGVLTWAPDTRPILFVSAGESNSGGGTVNDSYNGFAQSWELAARSEVQMYVAGTPWANLDIGTNNNLTHGGLDSTTHSWELGLANHARIGNFGSRPLYYLQTGSGGSLTTWWKSTTDYGGNWSAVASVRADAAKAALANYRPVVCITLGINDALAGTPIVKSVYKADMLQIVSQWKTKFPGALILLVKLPTYYDAGSLDYTEALQEIADADSSQVKTIEITGLEIYGDHWTYQGKKEMTHRIYDKIREYYSITDGRSFSWSAYGDGPHLRYTALAAPLYSYAAETINAQAAFAVVNEATDLQGNTITAIAENTTQAAWFGASDPYIIGWYCSGGNINILTKNDTTSMATYALTLPAWVRAVKSGNDILVQKSTDGGTTWTTIHTRTGILNGKGTLRVKTLTVSGSAERKLLLWRQYQ